MSAAIRDELLDRLHREGAVVLAGDDLAQPIAAIVRDLQAAGVVLVSVRDVLGGTGRQRAVVTRWVVRLAEQHPQRHEQP